jgi:oxygen-dependent protoporphyrinogen oxidase
VSDRRFAVVGGGIAGLAAAWELRDRGAVTVYEPGHLGGKLRTGTFEGRAVDLGPDAFLTRVPEAVDLCAELGLADRLVAPTTGAAWLVTSAGTFPMPAGTVLGAPKAIGAVARSGLLSPAGVARAGLDLVLPRRNLTGDVSVGELIGGRFGAQVADRLVDPLVGGIHAGRTDELSAAATVPQLLAAARRSRSLMRALAAVPAPSGSVPVFLTPTGGLEELVAALVEGLKGAGVELRATGATAVRALPGGGVSVGDDRYDGVVVATDADTAAALLGDAAPPALSTIPRASVAVVLMSFPAPELPAPPGISGLLVQRATGRLMTAASFASTKWPQWAAPGTTLLRVSAGRHRDERAESLGDDTLTARLVDEVGDVLATTATPTATRVVRWPRAFPQYLVSHLDKVDAIEAALRRTGPIAVAGGSYRGSGIPACIASGHRAARELAERASH